MNCLECQDILQRRLDGEAVDALVGLNTHLAECPECRLVHQTAQLLVDNLPHHKMPVPPAVLTRRIVNRVLADQKNRLASRRLMVRYLALAASLLLAVLAGLYWLPLFNSAKKEQQQLVQRDEPAPSLEKSVEDARQAVASLTEKSKDQVRALLSVANPMENNAGVQLPDLAAMEQPLEPAAESLRHTGHGVTEGLQTVASSTQRAFAYFFREFAPVDIGKQKEPRVN